VTTVVVVFWPTTAVGSESAFAVEPLALWAVTSTRSFEPTSAVRIVYVLAVAPAIEVQTAVVAVVQRCQAYV
jgi:hypothetical protein